jgi:ATP-dependent helicase HepA
MAELAPLLTPEILLGESWLKQDPRFEWLVNFLARQRGHKVLVICARADTAVELEQHLNLKHGIRSAVFHEGLSLVARDRAAAYFAEDEQGAQVLVCSEIGSEGRNFQFANQLVLFDLPLNPDLLEQRIGRLDRIGQRSDILLHVPFFEKTAQEVLLRWYHEGINAFEATCAIGFTQYQRFETQLEACMRNPGARDRTEALLQQTRESSAALRETLHAGRDHLIELNSFDKAGADSILEDLLQQERPHVLSAYMEKVFDQYGVEQEHHSATSVILRPGEHMLGHSFPALPEDGVTATFRREVALSREEFQYLTWEHPMVTGAMDMVLSGEFGNTALCTMKLPPFKTGTILLEAVFTLSCQAPASLQLQRYLPLTTVRIVVDSKLNDLSEILTEAHFRKLGKQVRRHNAQDFIRHTRTQIITMIERAEQLAGESEKSIIASAREEMQHRQEARLERLRALAEINPNIRRVEIDYLETETADLAHYFDLAHSRLDAVRVAVVAD